MININKMINKLIVFLASCLVWYGIVAFITWDWYLPTWHWVAKMLYFIFVVLTTQRVIDEK